jgi:outer membrane protein TolC
VWPAAGGAQRASRPVTPEQAAAELGIDLTQPLSQDDCIAIALRVHPDIRLAATDLKQAIAGVRIARAGLWPSVSALSSYRVTQQPTRTAVVGGSVIPVGGGRSTAQDNQVVGTLEVYRTGREQQIDQSRQYSRAARESYADAQRRLAYYIAQAYYDRLAAERLVTVNEDSETAAQGHVDLVQAQIDADDAAPVDIHRVRTELYQSRLALSSARNQAAIARATLWSALGEPAAPIEIIDVWQEPAPLPGLDECVVAAFQSRPDLAATQAGVKAARRGLELARLARRPQLHLDGMAEYGRHNGQSGTSWSVYGTLSQSIFDGGVNSAGVDQARAQLHAAKANLERLEQAIRLGVETAWLSLRQSAESIAAAEAAQTEARVSLDSAEERYAANVGILLEITDAQATATGADVSVVRAHYDYNTALADLEQAMGAPLPRVLPADE